MKAKLEKVTEERDKADDELSVSGVEILVWKIGIACVFRGRNSLSVSWNAR